MIEGSLEITSTVPLLQLIGCVNQTELLAWLGTKADTRDNAADVKKDMEKMKGQLIDALAAKGEALLKGQGHFLTEF